LFSNKDNFEKFYILGYIPVQSVENQIMPRRNLSPSSGSKASQERNQLEAANNVG
jgi:hypothetical protein